MRIFAAIAALLLAASTPASAQEGHWDARMGAVTGEVTVLPADGSLEVSGEAGMPLEAGDRVVVAEGASAEVALDGTSLISVRPKSELTIEKTEKGAASFYLAAGALLARIQKLGERSLRVRTPGAVAAVRGTDLGVEIEGDDAHFGVFDEGKVEVSAAVGGKPELLIANQETSVRKGAAPTHAIQLQRFTAHRARMRGHGRRLADLKAKWKALPPDQRRDRRRKAMERLRENRKKFLEKRAAMKQNAENNRRQNVERGRRQQQENLRKMEERRKKAIRNTRPERR